MRGLLVGAGGWSGATALALSLGAAFDLQLSAGWADGHCGWGNVLAEWGEWPGYVAAGLCALALLIEELAGPPAELRKARFAAKVLVLALVSGRPLFSAVHSLWTDVFPPPCFPRSSCSRRFGALDRWRR